MVRDPPVCEVTSPPLVFSSKQIKGQVENHFKTLPLGELTDPHACLLHSSVSLSHGFKQVEAVIIALTKWFFGFRVSRFVFLSTMRACAPRGWLEKRATRIATRTIWGS